MEITYPFKEIQEKWKKPKKRQDGKKTEEEFDKFYALIEFPYPSPNGMHVGNPRNYVAVDVLCRMKRMRDISVFFPIGWDVFGIFSENYIQDKQEDLFTFTRNNIMNFKDQLQILGISCDYENEISTADENFLKSTQFLFVLLFEHNVLCKIGKGWFFDYSAYIEDIKKELDLVDLPEHEKRYILSEIEEEYEEKTVELTFNNEQSLLLPVQYKKDASFETQNLYLYLDIGELSAFEEKILNWKSVKEYEDAVKDMSDFEITEFYKKKPYVELEGVTATFEKKSGIPVFVSRLLKSNILTDELSSFGAGKHVISISEERQWGEPIPLFFCPECKKRWSVPGKMLPIMPMQVSKTETVCPVCGGRAELEQGIISNWLASTIYYLLYCGDIFEKEPFGLFDSPWLPVDHYNGYNGSLHAAQHMMRTMAVQSFLKKIGVIKKEVMIKKRVCHGPIVFPSEVRVKYEDVINEYGADIYRFYILAFCEYEKKGLWSETFLKQCAELVDELWNVRFCYLLDDLEESTVSIKTNAILNEIYQAYESFAFEKIFELIRSLISVLHSDMLTRKDMKNILRALYPLLPFLCRELNEIMGFEPILE